LVVVVVVVCGIYSGWGRAAIAEIVVFLRVVHDYLLM